MRIVAVVGTLPFPRLVRALAALRRERPDLLVWAQHAGGGLAEGLEGAAFEDRDRILARMRGADVVICHGGSGTVRDAISTGHVPVVVPRYAARGEHVNDHQLEIREAFPDSIVFVPEPDATALLAAMESARGRRGEQGSGAGAPGPLAGEVGRILRGAGHASRASIVWRLLRVLTLWLPVRTDPRREG